MLDHFVITITDIRFALKSCYETLLQNSRAFLVQCTILQKKMICPFSYYDKTVPQTSYKTQEWQ